MLVFIHIDIGKVDETYNTFTIDFSTSHTHEV